MYHKAINGGKIMFNTQVKPVRDLRNNYPDIAKYVKKGDHVIITNNGKSEAVIIPFDDYDAYEEYLHIRYVKEKLAEAEAIADDPDNWITAEELEEHWNKWRSEKVRI